MRRFIIVLVLLLGVVTGAATEAQQPAPAGKGSAPRFSSEIAAFLKEDEANPPPKHAILFIGSSIFRQWKNLKEQMAPLPVFNRAFGGSRTADLLYYMDKVVFPYEPKVIVYYCGSNDVNAGIQPGEIYGNFRRFVEQVHAKLPLTRVYFTSINRAPEKIERWDRVDAANALIKELCASDKLLGFIDVNPVLFDKEGSPRMELYQPDKLHFLEPAYAELTAIIRPAIENAWKDK
ncbi:MAG: GDSL-type esterase/lipase family protein [Acidobacteriota bacterium]